jgi:hypothetical protein
MIAFMLTPWLSHLPLDVWARHHFSPEKIAAIRAKPAVVRDGEHEAVGVLDCVPIAEIELEAA